MARAKWPHDQLDFYMMDIYCNKEIPWFTKNVFQWLPVDCRKKRWWKEWKSREEKKDQTQRKLDEDFYMASWEGNWDEAKRHLDLGATNDFIFEDGKTSFIRLYSLGKKEIYDKLIKKHPGEYVRSTEILLAVQKHFSAGIRKKLEPSFGMEKWMGVWKETELTNHVDHVAKDAGLSIACWAEEWELAVEWINRGATNNFVTKEGKTALHWAAQKGSFKTVQIILDRFEQEIERKNTDYRTPLSLAFEMKNYEIAELMIKRSNFPIMQLMLTESVILRNTDRRDFEQGLSLINKSTDLKIQLKTNFDFIKTAKLTGHCKLTERCMSIVNEICNTKYNFTLNYDSAKTKEPSKVESFRCGSCFRSVSKD